MKPVMKGAIFDVDGTLLDSMAIWDVAATRYLKRLGIEAEKELGDILGVMTVEEGAQYIARKYQTSETPEQIARGVLDIVREFYFYEAELKPGAADFLKTLWEKGIPMAVATSGDRELVTAAFHRHGIDRYFRKILTCSEVGAGKTEPLIYQMAARELGCRTDEAYVFEDALYAVKTACNAGFRTVGVYDRFSGKDQEEIIELVDVYLTDFTEFHF